MKKTVNVIPMWHNSRIAIAQRNASEKPGAGLCRALQPIKGIWGYPGEKTTALISEYWPGTPGYRDNDKTPTITATPTTTHHLPPRFVLLINHANTTIFKRLHTTKQRYYHWS